MNEGGRRPLLYGTPVRATHRCHHPEMLHHCTIARPCVPVSRHVICMFSPLSCLANIPWVLL
jgi:hypothetical protein